MGWWTLHNILFFVLFCNSKGQYDSIRRFTGIDTYFARHNLENLKVPIRTTPRFTLLAPDLLRAGSQENIYLQADGMSKPVTVSISIQDFTKTTTLLQDSVTLNQDNGFYALKTIQLPLDNLNREEKKHNYVYLKVNFHDIHSEERILMVSFHSGYIFIQTDKPIYNPGDTVRFRAYVSSPSFKAFDSPITIDIQNPDGVVVNHFYRTRAVDGVFGETFPLSEFVNEGTWTITAKFDHWQQNTFTSQFEVKKYVLPAFNVTLTPSKSFLNLDDSELTVEISARYLYGEPVQGTAYVVFGVKINQEKIRLPSVKQVSDLERGVVSLSMEELKMAYPNIRSLVGSSVYVKASVLTKSGSDLVEKEKTGIQIVESPYVVSFKDTPKYFKPGLPFDFTIQVSHHDGSPARNVLVKVNLLDTPLTVSSGTTRATINMPTNQSPQTITVETTQADLRPEQQAKQQVTVQPFVTFNQRNKNYLYISTGTNRVSVGDNLSLKLSITVADQADKEHIKQITYLVLNKGKIIVAKRLDVQNHQFTHVGLLVTPEMMPSFRFVAFYSIPWQGREEVVPDSIWVDVADSCAGGLTVGPVGEVRRDYVPGKSFSFQVRGDPGAKVSLVAVDNAVYLLSKERLTQSKIWNVVEHGDIGCTRGGGRDATAVFSGAGLLYASNAGFKTGTRQALQCPGSARRRRSAELLQRKAQLESQYKEKLQRRCCNDGLRAIPMPYSCTRRSLYITEGWECMRAFRYCCATYRNEMFDTEIPTTPPPMTTPLPTTSQPPRPTFPYFGRVALSEPLMPYNRRNTGVHRGWGNERMGLRGLPGLPGPPEPEVHREYTHSVVNAAASAEYRPVIHSVEEEGAEEDEEEEEWEYLDKSDVYLRYKFFESWLWQDINLPSQADRDGFASMNVNNALPDSITEWGLLAISASPHTGFCVAEPYNFRAWKRFFVDLKLPYSVARNEQIEIKAVVHNYGYEDLHVRVVLMKTKDICSIAFKDRHTQEVKLAAGSSVVVPYTIIPLVVGKLPLEVMVVGRDMMGGDRIQKFLRVVLDGVQKTEVWTTVLNPAAEGGTQTVRMGKIELNSVVPNSQPETFINIRGNVLADSIDNSISEDSLASLIRMPGGCVEQNLATITLPLIATLYLERTSNWESVGVERKAEALRYIRRGYEKQLAYRKSDGSYPPYRSEGASTWITAYVVKVFSMAHSITGINEQQVTTMTGGLRGDDPMITLTAFVLIALTEAKQAGIRCNDPSANIESVTHNTAEYLKRALMKLGRRPYTVAIVSYALALQEKGRYNPTESLLRAAARGGGHWPDSKNTLFTLEATGYALLALVKMGRMEEAAVPFKWLNSQRRRGGGFGSTQSTMVVLQALSEYLINKPPPEDLSLDVDVRITGRKEIPYNFNPKTAYVARSSRLPANLDLEVQARGNGQGILEVVTYYNQLPEFDEKMPCKDFELNVTIEESSMKPPADVEKSYQITIKVRALGPQDVRMVVLDISLPTGFTPENSDLEMLSNSVDRYINNFQIVDNLSDRGSLIIHLFKVSHKEPEILIFRLQQNFKVGLLQPSSVTVYEYYNPDHRCSQAYTPSEDKEQLSQVCRDNVCRCTQGDCCVTKTDSQNFPHEERETFACKSLHHVFQVKVLSVSQSYYDKYEMEITRVIKLGVEAGVEFGQKRFFLSHGGCRDGLNLKQGSQYLIMGPKEDHWNTDSENGFIYMLGKNTWVERWPSSAECLSDPSLQAKCKSLDDTAHELSVNACRL
ncbi:A.superbus venom factor 1 [Larimichthys crocea]|uniref:A.superbus venom factor 1 n=1 Tax=Larimichthys crocea TaxID=215358 RepID=A0A6G0JAE0_LARCR|nr:A.superbus venom factor 1 [Larimichthys crocea]